MGLDQYLSAKKYVSGYAHSSDETRAQFKAVLDAAGIDLTGLADTNSLYVTPVIGYWRKSNQIHAWFVRNVQDDVDDCGNYYVGREKLEELLETCKEIAATFVWGETVTVKSEHNPIFDYEQRNLLSMDTELADRLLAPTSGFFFGSTDYDGWYAGDIESTVKQLGIILDNESLKDCDFEYHSSW